MNPFNEAKNVTTKTVDGIKSPYMVNKILSCSPETFVASVKMNKYIGRLPNNEMAQMFNLCVKKSNRPPFFHYIKKQKKTEEKLIQKTSSFFCVNIYHAKQIIFLLRKMNIKPEYLFGLKKGE